MKWRTLRPRALAVALLVLPAVVVLPHAGATLEAKRPTTSSLPNVVVIMTDDQTLESLRVMRNVRTLIAANGATFTNAVASFPLCCPSRASFLTGQYSHNHGVVGNAPANGLERLRERNTLPVWLQKRGYSTIFVGKYLNGYGKATPRRIPPGWTEWYAGVTVAYFNHSMNRNGKLVRYRSAASDYQTDVYARAAAGVVRRRARGERPFFLWLSFFAPHEGSPFEDGDPEVIKTPVPAPRHHDRFLNEPFPLTPAFNEEDVSDKPFAIRRRSRFNPVVIDAVEANYRQRLASLLSVDEAVGRLVATLRESGELDRTLIVFTSDNGFLQGEHRLRAAKEYLYEPSIRVPLLIRGPGIPRGIKIHEPVANIDVAPTIVDVADARAALVMDGRSLVPLFHDRGLHWGRDILLERGPGGAGLVGRLFTAIRTPRYVYAEHHDNELELYDLVADPHQLANTDDVTGLDPMQAELARRLEALRECAGVACRRGPRVTVALDESAGCARRAVLTGGDATLLRSVHFATGRRTMRVDRAPYQWAIPTTGRAVKLRVVSTLVDGRKLTIDRLVTTCSAPAATAGP